MSGRTTRGVRASVGTGAAGRQQLRDGPSGTTLWVESSSSWFAGSKSVQAHRGGVLTRLAEELLQALERKESWKPAKGGRLGGRRVREHLFAHGSFCWGCEEHP